MSSSSGKNPLVSVIIVNWNGRHWLEKCLPTLYAQTYTEFETIIVDNGSADGSVDWLKREWSQVSVLAQSRNLGFAQANNVGISKAAGQFIVTLNNDTMLEPDWLAALVAGVDAPDVGMVASHIVLWQQPHLLDSTGIEVDMAGIAWNRGWMQVVSETAVSPDVFGPSACAALYRRDMLDEIGLFDENFLAYYEDVDLAWRAQNAGWRCRYAPSARLMHWHSATANKDPALKQFLLGRNKLWTIVKNYQCPALLKASPLIILYDFLATGYQTIQSRNLASLRGRLAAVAGIEPILQKRKPARQAVPLARVQAPWKGRIKL